MGGGPKYAQPEFDDELIGDTQKELKNDGPYN